MSEANAVSVKLLPSTLNNPAKWFRRAEATFRIPAIKSDITMADHTLSAMSAEVFERLEPWLAKQPLELSYKVLKTVIWRFSLSSCERAQGILELAGQL